MSLLLDVNAPRLSCDAFPRELVGIWASALTVGAVVADQPLLGVLFAGAFLCATWLVRQPEQSAPLVVFALWANLPVVAMRDHGAPAAIGGAAILALGLPLITRLIRNPGSVRAPVGSGWVLAYVGFSAVSAALSRDGSRSAAAVTELILEGALVFGLAATCAADRRSLTRVLWGLLGAGAFMGAIVLMQQLTRAFHTDLGGFGMIDSGFDTGEVTTKGEVHQPRLAGPIGEKNRFGQILLVAAGMGIGLAQSVSDRLRRHLALVCTGLCLIGIALTFSRGNAVAVALLLGIAALVRIVPRKAVFGAGLAMMVVLLALPQFRSRLATLANTVELISPSAKSEGPDGAIKGRATEVIAAVLVYVDYPILGVGPDLFPTYCAEYGNKLGIRRLHEERGAHTLFPHVAAEGGTLGLLAFTGLLVTLTRRLRRIARAQRGSRNGGLAAALFLGIWAYLLSGLFLHLSFIRYYWLLVGLAAAAVSVLESEDEQEPA